MIASYGKAGAIYEAFNCVDEMVLNGIKPTIDVFNNLLCGCISQPVYGFKYALLVWQMCLKFKITPNMNTYNLLLKAKFIFVRSRRKYLQTISSILNRFHI